MDVLFPIDDIDAQVTHAAAAESHRPSFAEQAEWADVRNRSPFALTDEDRAQIVGSPALWLVKDAGIYLMSNGVGDDRPDVVYGRLADGTVLDDSLDVWDLCRDIAGGDDFAEPLPVDVFADLGALRDAGATDLFVRFVDDEIEIGYITPTEPT